MPKPNGYVLNYVILTTHSSHLYSMWDFTHTCNPTSSTITTATNIRYMDFKVCQIEFRVCVCININIYIYIYIYYYTNTFWFVNSKLNIQKEYSHKPRLYDCSRYYSLRSFFQKLECHYQECDYIEIGSYWV